MSRCDACGQFIPEKDYGFGAIKAPLDQPELDTLCIKCNKESDDVDMLSSNRKS